MGDNSERVKIYWNFSNQQANFNQTWYISSLGKGNSKLFKLRARSSSKGRWLQKFKIGLGSFKNLLKNHGVRRAHGSGGATIGKTICTYVYIEKKNLLLQNQQASLNQTWYELSFGKGNSKLFKLRSRSFS
jgi:hypothetical protein